MTLHCGSRLQLTWQDSGGGAQFVDGPLQHLVAPSQRLQKLGLLFVDDLFHLNQNSERIIDAVIKYSRRNKKSKCSVD